MDQSASAPSRAPVTAQEQKSIDTALQRLLRLPYNACCADCGARHPRWASVNIGVVICLECSGIHRNMGVHISKVKSVTLDRWTEQWVKTLEAVGNEVAKAYYEHALPADFKRPTRADDQSAIENWIRSKYERKNYVPRDILEPWVIAAEGRDPREAILNIGFPEKDASKRRKELKPAPEPTGVSFAAAESTNDCCLLGQGNDLISFPEQIPSTVATSGTCTVPAVDSVATSAELSLNSTDQRVKAAKEAIARLYSKPAEYGVVNPACSVRPVSLEGLNFFEPPKNNQLSQTSHTASWACWSPPTNSGSSTYNTNIWPPASSTPPMPTFPFEGATDTGPPASCVRGCAFDTPGIGRVSQDSAPRIAETTTFSSIPSTFTFPCAPSANPLGLAATNSMSGVIAAVPPVSICADTQKQVLEPQNPLSNLDAFALVKKVNQPSASSATTSADSYTGTTPGLPQPLPAAPVGLQQHEPLLLI